MFGDFAKYAKCIDDTSDLYIQGDPFAVDTAASLSIELDPCISDEYDNCESDSEIYEWINGSRLDIMFDYQQIDMKNSDQPI